MTFAQYINEVGINKVAELIGVSTTQVYRYENLSEAPRPELARKIKKLTHGLVDYEDIYEPFFSANEKSNDKQLKLKV